MDPREGEALGPRGPASAADVGVRSGAPLPRRARRLSPRYLGSLSPFHPDLPGPRRAREGS